MNEYVPITKWSRQRYAWSYIEIRNKVKIIGYDWSSLTNRDISNKYRITIRKKLDNPVYKYKSFVTAHIEAVEECIPTKPRF